MCHIEFLAKHLVKSLHLLYMFLLNSKLHNVSRVQVCEVIGIIAGCSSRWLGLHRCEILQRIPNQSLLFIHPLLTTWTLPTISIALREEHTTLQVVKKKCPCIVEQVCFTFRSFVVPLHLELLLSFLIV